MDQVFLWKSHEGEEPPVGIRIFLFQSSIRSFSGYILPHRHSFLLPSLLILIEERRGRRNVCEVMSQIILKWKQPTLDEFLLSVQQSSPLQDSLGRPQLLNLFPLQIKIVGIGPRVPAQCLLFKTKK